MPRVAFVVPLATLLSLAALAHAAPPRAPRQAPPARAQSFDTARRLDINQLNLFVGNNGTIGNDYATGSAGLLFPRGTGKAVLYSSGLWVGGLVAGLPRVAIAEYEQEYVPGSMVGVSSDDHTRPEYVVWKVRPWTGDPADTAHAEQTSGELAADPTMDPVLHHGWSEYMANAAPHGAPVRQWTLPGPGGVGTQQVTGPDVSGDLMLWCVFNDAHPAFHTAAAGHTQPLGIEVRQSVFAFDRPGPLGQTAFVRWRIVNHGGQAIDSARVAFWLDPDIGGSIDDLAGCDSIRSMGFAYNATDNDFTYGSMPPALGADLVDDAFDPVHGRVLGMTSFGRYFNGADPATPAETWNILRGLSTSGAALVNPETSQPTTYDRSGDPVTQTGWLDAAPSDRRMILVRGPHHLDPGDSIEVTAALVVAQGGDRIASIAQLQCWDDWVQNAWVQGFPAGMPAVSCSTPLNCPRPSSFYADECEGAGHLSPNQLGLLTLAVGNNANSVLWPESAGWNGFCAAMANGGDARAQAKREYAALLANRFAKLYGAVPSGTSPITLDPNIPVSVSGFSASTLVELTQPGSASIELIGEYRDLNAAHAPAIAGVDAGLRAFGGGADYAFDFFGSTLDPNSAPADSFPTVELVFDAAHPQKAYRFLRLEQPDGSLPVNGREYRYGGFFDVPFVARDSATGEQLEVAFAERAVTDADGTILDASFQFATFDSTWSPDAGPLGGREYVMVMHRPYDGVPHPQVAVDGEFVAGDLPWLYALWARRVDPASEFDAGDRFAWTHHHPFSPGVDQRLIDLEGQSLGDPQVVAAYEQITQGIGALNEGVGVPTICDDPTPALASLVEASAQPGRVDLDWYLSGASRAAVQRNAEAGGWLTVATLDADGSGHLRWQDATVEPGRRYGYRLEFGSDGAPAHSDAVWVDVPLDLRLALPGFRPNPARAAASVAFTLAGRERALLEIVDVSGRRVLSRDVGAFGPGTHALALPAPLAPGIYWLRLTQAGASVSTRGVVVR